MEKNAGCDREAVGYCENMARGARVRILSVHEADSSSPAPSSVTEEPKGAQDLFAEAEKRGKLHAEQHISTSSSCEEGNTPRYKDRPDAGEEARN